MKRSEMVKYLAKLLNTYEDCQIDETCANEVLEGLENMGMLPPSYHFEDGDLGSKFINKWEPEDE